MAPVYFISPANTAKATVLDEYKLTYWLLSRLLNIQTGLSKHNKPATVIYW